MGYHQPIPQVEGSHETDSSSSQILSCEGGLSCSANHVHVGSRFSRRSLLPRLFKFIFFTSITYPLFPSRIFFYSSLFFPLLSNKVSFSHLFFFLSFLPLFCRLQHFF